MLKSYELKRRGLKKTSIHLQWLGMFGIQLKCWKSHVFTRFFVSIQKVVVGNVWDFLTKPSSRASFFFPGGLARCENWNDRPVVDGPWRCENGPWRREFPVEHEDSRSRKQLAMLVYTNFHAWFVSFWMICRFLTPRMALLSMNRFGWCFFLKPMDVCRVIEESVKSISSWWF